MHTHPTETSATARPAGPIDQVVTCPLCEYNLRGLCEPRCPECGYGFTWDELRDPNRQSHPYLFEHHPRRNVWSFFQTLKGAQRPRTFWQTLSPVQPSRPRRLAIYAFLINGVLVLALAVGLFLSMAGFCVLRMNQNRRTIADEMAYFNSPNASQRTIAWRDRLVSQYGSLQNYFGAIYPTSLSQLLATRSIWIEFISESAGVGVFVALLSAAWPWLTLLALSIFQVSMHRARIRTIHVLRCIIYSADCMLWAGVLCIPALALQNYLQTVRYNRGMPVGDIWGWLAISPMPVAIAIIGWMWLRRMNSAYRYYLRFDRPRATVFASQIIVLLIATNVAFLPIWIFR